MSIKRENPGLRQVDQILYLSQHFILVEIIFANQSESKFLSFPLKFSQNSSQENQSIDFNEGKMKLLMGGFHFSLVSYN